MADTGKFATTTHDGDGSTVTFNLGFPMLDESHILVTVDDVATTAFTIDLSALTITFDAAPASGTDNVVLKRQTAHTGIWVGGQITVFQDGGGVPASDLNNAYLQGLYYTEEQQDRIYDLENP